MARVHPRPADRISAQEWARDLLRNPFYIMDTETTGVDQKAEIVQIGIIDGEGETVLSTLVKPSQRIPYEASLVHGIYDEHVESAPTIADLYVQLSSRLAGVPLVAYNMDFDWRMFEQTFRRYGLPLIRTGRRTCAMKYYAMYYGEWNAMRGSYKWQKLGEAARQQRIKLEKEHEAIGDCLMTLGLIIKMAKA